jgi:hypothetical protein
MRFIGDNDEFAHNGSKGDFGGFSPDPSPFFNLEILSRL